MTGGGELGIWTVTRDPTDLPGVAFAARLHIVEGGGSYPTHQLVTGQTLDDVRSQLPPGLYCLGRDPADDAAIVESWI
jgi:hypothetical protein